MPRAGSASGASQGRGRRTPPDRPDADDRSRPVGRAIVGTLRDPVIIVFLLAGTFDVLSGDRVIDGAVLFAVALALGWDVARDAHAEHVKADSVSSAGQDPPARPLGELPEPTPSLGNWANLRLSRVAAIAGLVYAVLVAGLARYSWPATIAVGTPAAIGVAIVWRRPMGDATAPRRIPAAGGLAWASVFVALGLWELAALLLQPSLTTDSWAHPTISVLMEPILATHLGRSIVLSLWLASGWVLLRL